MAEARGRGFKELIRVEPALQRFFEALGETSRPVEQVPIMNALGRVLASDVKSKVDIPPFDRAAMDGYAVVAEDTFGSSSTNPLMFDIAGRVDIGGKAKVRGGRGRAVSIVTGAPIPPDTDAVIMLEYTRKPKELTVEILKAVTPGDNVSRKGEDVQKDSVILRRGTVLKPQDIGMLAGIGSTTVDVVLPPLVGVLSTGDELTQLGDALEQGKIYDVNRPVSLSLIREMGCIPMDLGICRDDPKAVATALREGLSKADVLLVSAGTSVGERDIVPSIVNSLGSPGVLVHGVAIRPAVPTGLAVIDGKPIVLLPGFPVAAMVAFDAFVKPLLNRLLGSEATPIPKVKARMLRRVPSHGGLRAYARVKVRRDGDNYVAEPLRVSGAGVISSMVKADGLLIIPEDKEGVEEGEVVEVILLRPVK
ncbi:MAG: molybdopterin molybdotransferase MoeA [Thaumarchaeota archaeon]|nr:molybdopterin molybdotransferase MoeA [Nitrososphaerota archaeon]